MSRSRAGVLILALAGCTSFPDTAIDVRSPDLVLRFPKEAKACEIGFFDEEGRALWHVIGFPPAFPSAAGTIRYGRVPPGFEQRRPPPGHPPPELAIGRRVRFQVLYDTDSYYRPVHSNHLWLVKTAEGFIQGGDR